MIPPALQERHDPALAWWLLGVAVAHALRLLVFDEAPPRQAIAIGGTLLYAHAGIFAVARLWPAAGVIAIAGPVVGLGTVLAVGARVDDWQLAVGVTQAAALVYVVGVWASARRRASAP